MQKEGGIGDCVGFFDTEGEMGKRGGVVSVSSQQVCWVSRLGSKKGGIHGFAIEKKLLWKKTVGEAFESETLGGPNFRLCRCGKNWEDLCIQNTL